MFTIKNKIDSVIRKTTFFKKFFRITTTAASLPIILKQVKIGTVILVDHNKVDQVSLVDQNAVGTITLIDQYKIGDIEFVC